MADGSVVESAWVRVEWASHIAASYFNPDVPPRHATCAAYLTVKQGNSGSPSCQENYVNRREIPLTGSNADEKLFQAA